MNEGMCEQLVNEGPTRKKAAFQIYYLLARQKWKSTAK
jgi:hypothetical protein